MGETITFSTVDENIDPVAHVASANSQLRNVSTGERSSGHQDISDLLGTHRGENSTRCSVLQK